jgi:transposase
MIRIELKVIVEQIRSLNQSIAELEKTITEESQKLRGHKNLTSIKGIGPLTGSILLSVIGDIHDFAHEGKLAADFGIVPRVSNSNETERSGWITKRGSKIGRTALVQCGLIAQRYSPYLNQFYEKTKSQARHWQGDHHAGTQAPRNHLSDSEEQLGLLGPSQFRSVREMPE